MLSGVWSGAAPGQFDALAADLQRVAVAGGASKSTTPLGVVRNADW